MTRKMTTATTVTEAAPGLTARDSVMAALTKDGATIGAPTAILTATAITSGKILLVEGRLFQTKKEEATRPVPPPDPVTYVRRKLPAVTDTAVAFTTPSATTSEIIALRHRLSLVNRQSSTIELRAVQRRDSALGLAAGAHFNKAEASGLTRELIRDYVRRFHCAVRREKFL